MKYFYLAVAIIAGISFYDAYLVVANSTEILDFEQNPVGLFLIRQSIPLFVSLKGLGTVLVVSILITLANKYRYSKQVVIAVLSFQLFLLTFLEW